MKKILKLIVFIFISFLLISCEELTTTHVHKSSLWQYDEDNHYHLCETCNLIYDKGNHSFTSKVIIEASEDNDEVIQYTCSVCGYQYKEVVHKHIYSTAYSYDQNFHWFDVLCEHKDLIVKEAHVFSNTTTIKEATETETGEQEKHCLICGYQVIIELPKLVHTHQANNYDHDENTHYKICLTCNTKYDIAYHTFSEWNTTLEPTDTDTGLQERICSVCGYKEERTLDSTQHYHTVGNTRSYDSTYHYFVCTVCGEQVDKDYHTMGSWNTTKQPTETENGIRERSCIYCGYKETDTIEKLAHSHVSDGTYYYNEDTHYLYCTSCHNYYGEENHTFSSWYTETEATYTYNGLKSRTCSVCGYKQEEVIPVIVAITYNVTYDEDYIYNNKHDKLYSTGNYQTIGNLDFYRFNYDYNDFVILSGYPDSNYNNIVAELPSAVYNTTSLGKINYLSITYKSSSDSYVYYSTDRSYDNYYLLPSSYSYTTVEINLESSYYFKITAGDYDLAIDTLKLSTSSGSASATNKTYEGYRVNPESYSYSNLTTGTKRSIPVEVSYQNGTYTVIREKEYTYYDRNEAYSYISNYYSLGKYQNGVLTDPIDVANYYLLFHDFPVNYIDKNSASSYTYYFGNDTRCVSTYSRTDGYATAVPLYTGYGLVYYELDLALNSSYSPSNRGVGRLIVFATGYNVSDYGENPVIIYTDDHYATFAEYNNVGSFLPRFDAEKSYFGTTWCKVTTLN